MFLWVPGFWRVLTNMVSVYSVRRHNFIKLKRLEMQKNDRRVIHHMSQGMFAWKKMLHSTKRSGNFILFFKHYIKYSLSESQTPVQENVQGRLYLPQSLSKDALQGRGWEAMSWGFGWLSLWGERAHTHGRCCLQSRMEWLWCLEATASQPASLPSELCMPLFLPSRWSPSLTNTGRKLDLKHRALEHGCLGILFLKKSR